MVIIFILTLYVENGTFRANVYAAAAVEHRAQMHDAKNRIQSNYITAIKEHK